MRSIFNFYLWLTYKNKDIKTINREGEMAYKGTCLCENIKFEFEFDPKMHFQCHCTICQKFLAPHLMHL